MISKKSVFLIILVISVLFAVSLSGCFDGGETDNTSASSATSAESPVTSESFSDESFSSSESENESDNDSDNDDSVNVSEEESSESEKNDKFFTVNFDSDGGSAVNAVTVKSGEKIPEPKSPIKATLEKQYVFKGWYYGDLKWDFKNDVVTENVTLTAKWELTGDFTVGF